MSELIEQNMPKQGLSNAQLWSALSVLGVALSSGTIKDVIDPPAEPAAVSPQVVRVERESVDVDSLARRISQVIEADTQARVDKLANEIKAWSDRFAKIENARYAEQNARLDRIEGRAVRTTGVDGPAKQFVRVSQ